jgi:hypothetical protein
MVWSYLTSVCCKCNNGFVIRGLVPKPSVLDGTVELSIEVYSMSDQQIIEYYDSKLNMSIVELALITGKSVKALKRLLMGV